MKDKDQKYFNLGDFFSFFFFPKPNQTENQRTTEHGISALRLIFAGNSPAGRTRWSQPLFPLPNYAWEFPISLSWHPFTPDQPSLGKLSQLIHFLAATKHTWHLSHTWMCVWQWVLQDALMGAAEEQGSGMEPWPHSQLTSSPWTHPQTSHNFLFSLGSAQTQPQLPVLGPSRALLDQFPTGIASPRAAVVWRGEWFLKAARAVQNTTPQRANPCFKRRTSHRKWSVCLSGPLHPRNHLVLQVHSQGSQEHCRAE